MSNIDKLISEQVLAWSKREFDGKPKKESHRSWPAITISREFGAGGISLAKELGKRIGFKVWDKELLSAMAEEAGADEQFLATLDEKRRKMIDDMLASSFMGFKHSNTNYFKSLQRVVHTIEALGKSIVVGRGSHYIMKSPNVMRIRVICPFEKRVAYLSEKNSISLKDAEELIIKREAERADFVQHFFRQNPEDPHDYALVLNSGVLSIEQMADIVILAYEKITGKKVAQPA
ncbi:MAG: cytidylate kinase-like family protein [Bacteroidia bacterium]|nr:cytidylate kinase-like family protein [Bacteroidia bacterium]